MWIIAGCLLLLCLIGAACQGDSYGSGNSARVENDDAADDESNLIPVLLAGHEHDGHGHHHDDGGNEWN